MIIAVPDYRTYVLLQLRFAFVTFWNTWMVALWCHRCLQAMGRVS